MARQPVWVPTKMLDGGRRGTSKVHAEGHDHPGRSGDSGFPRRQEFNSIPWVRIVEALRHHVLPAILLRDIKAYLSDRFVVYTNRDGEVKRPVERGLPQVSVLGPIFWITAYDRGLGVLRERHLSTPRRTLLARNR
jgi:hypothetical protein